MNLSFTQFIPVKSYQHVVEQIQTAICNEELKKGDRLPSEMKLKDIFNTSRGTIREALRVLEQKGLITIKTGVKGGPVIKGPSTDAMSESMALLIRQRQISLEHLAQFRELLEGFAAEQAALLSSPGQHQELERIIEKIQEHLDAEPQDWQEFHRLDSQFHQMVATLARNPLLLVNLETIHQNIEVYFQQYLPFSLSLLEDDFNDLKNIYLAIRESEMKAAGELAREHVAKFSRLMKKHQGEDKKQ